MLPKDVVVNVIIPKIVEDKNREIARLEDIISGILYYRYDDLVCETCGKKIIVEKYGGNYIYNEIHEINSQKDIYVICKCSMDCYTCKKQKGKCTDCGHIIKFYKALIII